MRSTIGVPSIASRPLTWMRIPSRLKTRTRCRPIGLGLLEARVLKTPCSGRVRSPRGCTVKTRRSASCNQVSTMISSPTAMPSRPAWTSESKIRYAVGAPSSPWRGASAVDVSGLFTCPIGRIVKVDPNESAIRHSITAAHLRVKHQRICACETLTIPWDGDRMVPRWQKQRRPKKSRSI